MVLSKAQLARYFYLAPSEIERMPYWEYELFREKANEIIEEENKEQEGGGKHSQYKKDADRYMRDAKSYNSNLSKYTGSSSSGGFSMPSMPSLPSVPGLPSGL